MHRNDIKCIFVSTLFLPTSPSPSPSLPISSPFQLFPHSFSPLQCLSLSIFYTQTRRRRKENNPAFGKGTELETKPPDKPSREETRQRRQPRCGAGSSLRACSAGLRQRETRPVAAPRAAAQPVLTVRSGRGGARGAGLGPAGQSAPALSLKRGEWGGAERTSEAAARCGRGEGRRAGGQGAGERRGKKRKEKKERKRRQESCGRGERAGARGRAQPIVQTMAKVQVNNVVVLDNPSPFYNPFQFEITFECIEDLSEGEAARTRRAVGQGGTGRPGSGASCEEVVRVAGAMLPALCAPAPAHRGREAGCERGRELPG